MLPSNDYSPKLPFIDSFSLVRISFSELFANNHIFLYSKGSINQEVVTAHSFMCIWNNWQH